jgi:serpin B
VPYAAFTGGGEYFATPHEIPRNEAERPQLYPGEAGFSMIELPYKGDVLSMILIVPRSADGLAALEEKLTIDSLEEWLQRLERRTVDIKTPRFKIESSVEMGSALRLVGMRLAFDPARAQFTGMAASETLSIGSVHHKAWVEVNEKGTEAAAATGMMIVMASRGFLTSFTPQFYADRPFLFLIRDMKTGVILFMGRMTDPKSA